MLNFDGDVDANANVKCERTFSEDTSIQFYTSHLLLGLSVGIGLSRCKHTITETKTGTCTETDR